jgi:hypothetical protein
MPKVNPKRRTSLNPLLINLFRPPMSANVRQRSD